VTIRESPLIGRDVRLYTEIQKFGKEEYFWVKGLAMICCFARRITLQDSSAGGQESWPPFSAASAEKMAG